MSGARVGSADGWKGRAMRSFRVPKCDRVNGIRFLSEGGLILLFSGDEGWYAGTIIWVDQQTGAPIRAITPMAKSALLSSDQSKLFCAIDAGSAAGLFNMICWRDPADQENVFHSRPIGAQWTRDTASVVVNSLAFSADEKRLLVGFARGRLPSGREQFWEYFVSFCPSGDRGKPITRGMDMQVKGLTASPDGVHWAAAEGLRFDYQVRLYQEKNPIPVASFTKPGIHFHTVTYSPDGRFVAAIQGRKVYLLTGDGLKLMETLDGHKGQVNDIAVSSDSRQIYTASNDGNVRVWDTGSGRLRQSYDWKIGPVTSLCLANDGLTCTAGGNKGRIVVWDTE